ncbi:MAG: hypothetical protein AOA66_1755 [Candidatus Bathyarchaeota archaeon BA2]|nr:MAG: hypothetical protein AOA66_1755 [Candidatus Bathyarchaeota archaeon BA2]
MIKIEVNGEKLEVYEKSTILDAINIIKAPYAKDCKIIAIKRGGESISEPHLPRDFFIETPKGKFSIRVEDSLLPFWLKHYQDFQGVEFGWITKKAVTFGSIDLSHSGLKATKEKIKYHCWDVFLSFGGFDPAFSYICFSWVDHEGVYGAPKENWGIIGRVISGGHVILELERGDSILRIYPSTIEGRKVLVLRPEEIGEKTVEDNIQILTYVKATLDERTSNCAEHFLATVGDFFKVSHASSMFICNEKFVGIPLPKENTGYRPKGAITVRNTGTKVGAIYIYRNDAPFTSSHSVVGSVVHGVELVEHANPGDKILVKTTPERLMVVGMSQGQAANYLSQRRIRHIRVGDENDQAIIIEQRPKLTMEVKGQGSVVTLGVNPKFINHINMHDEESPRSVLHFRMVADMIYSPIGKLHVFENTGEALILSGPGNIKTIKSVSVETTPSNTVEEGTIGVTNSRKKLSGLIGIRLKASKTYGPTGEPFEATNIIGRIIGDLDLLKNKNAGDTIYFMEEKCE